LRIYAGSVAGDEPDMVRKMRLGQLQAGSISSIGLSRIDRAFDVFTIPMFYESYEELFAVMESLEPLMTERLSERGFVFLGWGMGGWARLFTKNPVRTVDDLRRAKMFVAAGDDPWVQYWKNNGFRPVPLAVTDIMTGLQTGLIDGLATTPLAALMLQWYRHAPYMIDIDLAPLIGATLVSEKAWQRIPEESRATLISSARELGNDVDLERARAGKGAPEGDSRKGRRGGPRDGQTRADGAAAGRGRRECRRVAQAGRRARNAHARNARARGRL